MNMKRVWAIAFTYTGAVIGAGFSSGQEIWYFFARHEIYGLWGLLLTALMFIGLMPFLLYLGKELQIESYQDYFYRYMPAWAAVTLDLAAAFFLAGSVSVMVAGSGTIFRDVLGTPYLTGVSIILVFVLATLYLKVEGIFSVNSYLVPILIVITVLTVVRFIPDYRLDFFGQIIRFGAGQENWLKDALLYSSYNITIALAAISGIINSENKKLILLGGMIGGLVLIFLNLIIFLGLKTAFYQSPREEIPMLVLALRTGKNFYLLYVVALFFAMVSTAVVNYYALTKRLSQLLHWKYAHTLLLITLIILPLTLTGFSTLVQKMYAFFGYLGIIMLISTAVALINKYLRDSKLK